MINYADDAKIKLKSIQFLTSDSMEIDVSIHLLEIIIKVGRHYPIILLSLASLDLLLAANDFLANSLYFAILNSMFALSNFISLVQICQWRKTHSNEYRSSYNRIDKTVVLGIGK